jgi:hypothetical protein
MMLQKKAPEHGLRGLEKMKKLSFLRLAANQSG